MKLDLKSLSIILFAKLQLLNRFRVVIFILLVAGLYGYLVLQINSATSVQPADSGQQVGHATAHVDPTVVEKIKQLQDNSVSVQALFNQARSNPFQ